MLRPLKIEGFLSYFQTKGSINLNITKKNTTPKTNKNIKKKYVIKNDTPKLYNGKVKPVKRTIIKNNLDNTYDVSKIINNKLSSYSNSKSLKKALSNVKHFTTSGSSNCINYIFNIEGGPRGPPGEDGATGATGSGGGGATADCNGYYINQDLLTSSDVEFKSVSATNSYTLDGVSVTSLQWNHLSTMDQDVNTTSDVTFNSVTATTSYTLGGTTVTATQWNHLATMDQDVNTTSDVTFNSVTATTSYTLGSTSVTATQWNYLATMDQDVNTTADVIFNRVVCSSNLGLNMATSFTPLSTSSPSGVTGDIVWDDDYIYVKTNDGWKRAGLTSY